MKRKLIAIAIVVVAVVLVAWRWKSGTSEGASGKRDDESALVAAGGAGAGDSATHRAAKPPTVPASVAGRVTRKSDGAGIAGATVSLARGEFGSEIIPAEQPTIVVTTAPDGSWTAAHVAPGTYIVAATALGFLPLAKERVAVASGEQKTGVDLALDVGGTVVHGTVSDVGGGPIPGARVTAHHQLDTLATPADFVAVTGPDGTYQLSLPDGQMILIARHDDYTKSSRSIELKGKPLVADFVLVPGGVIRGQVVARDTNKPVPGALVSAENGSRHRGGSDGAALADDEGRFTLRHLDSGLVKLTANGQGYATAQPITVPLAIGQQLDDVRVVVDRAYSITGTAVTKGTGKPIAGVRVAAFSFGTKQQAIAIDPTEADGRFEIVGVKPASYMLFALAEGMVPDMGKNVEVVDKDVDIKLELDGGVTLSGHVDPPGRAEVSLTLAGEIGLGNMFEMVKVALVRADADDTGAFTLHAVPPGKLVVVATTTAGPNGKLDVTVADADQKDLVVRLEPKGTLVGKVVDTNDAPVAGVEVRAHETKGAMTVDFNEGKAGVTTGSDGSFKIVGLETGTVTVSVSDDDGPIAFKDPKKPPTFDVSAGKDTPATIVVEARDGVIKGRVVDKSGAPIADAWVTAHQGMDKPADAGDVSVEFGGDFGATTKPVLTKSDGAFAFDHLRHGTYEVVAEGPAGGSRASKDGVKLGDSVTLTLAPLGTLSGTVERGPVPVQTYDLSCTGPDGELDRRISNPDGAYSLDHLAPGPYTCSANTDGGTAKGTVTVGEGDAHLDLALTDWATVSGTVVSVLTGKPIAGLAAVALGSANNDQMFLDAISGKTVTTDDGGHFTVDRVPAGSGKLVLYPKAGALEQLSSQPYTAAAGQHVDLGTIKVVPPRQGDAGTLGMGTSVDSGALVVTDVKAGGPAEGAGVKAGDKIASIDGVPVDSLTPAIGQQLISSGTVGVGQAVQLGLDRGGAVVPVTVVAAKW